MARCVIDTHPTGHHPTMLPVRPAKGGPMRLATVKVALHSDLGFGADEAEAWAEALRQSYATYLAAERARPLPDGTFVGRDDAAPREYEEVGSTLRPTGRKVGQPPKSRPLYVPRDVPAPDRETVSNVSLEGPAPEPEPEPVPSVVAPDMAGAASETLAAVDRFLNGGPGVSVVVIDPPEPAPRKVRRSRPSDPCPRCGRVDWRTIAGRTEHVDTMDRCADWRKPAKHHYEEAHV